MTPASVRDYIATLRPRYSVASRALKHQILDELCATAHYTRKGAIRALTHPPAGPQADRRGRPPLSPPAVHTALAAVWEAAGYPWSVERNTTARIVASRVPNTACKTTDPPFSY